MKTKNIFIKKVWQYYSFVVGCHLVQIFLMKRIGLRKLLQNSSLPKKGLRYCEWSLFAVENYL